MVCSLFDLTLCTVKRVDEVVRHPHLVTQDQFTQVSKKVSDIPEENFTINIELIVYKCRTSSTELEFFKSNTAWAQTCIFTSTIFYSTTAPHLPYVKWVMYIVYILFMNHMHAGEWERAPGRTFTYNIQHTLICSFIIIEDVTHPSRNTGLQMQIFDKYCTWAIVNGGGGMLCPEMGKHPDLLVAHPTSTIFTTIGRNYEIS